MKFLPAKFIHIPIINCNLPVLAFLFFILLSCSQEKKLAKLFVRSSDSTIVLLLSPDDIGIIKKNEVLADNTAGDQVNDSSGIVSSQLLKNLSDQTLKDIIYTNLYDGLIKLPIKVFGDESMNTFMELNKRSYIVKIAQIEVDEFVNPYTASEQFDTLTYYEEFDLLGVSINIWIDITEVNGTQDTLQIVFSNEHVLDVVEGYFRRNPSGMVEFIYQRTDVSVDDIYSMASEFGRKNAGYLYDYFLNKYVHQYYNGTAIPKYYHFDFTKGKLYQAGFSRFIFL